MKLPLKLNRKMKLKIIVLFLFCCSLSYSQNIYPIKFEGCNTDHFALESKLTTTKTDIEKFINLIRNNTSDKIKGVLAIQVIVDIEGKSCLISMENKTNLKTAQLKKIKMIIDNELFWENSKDKVSPMYEFKFNKKSVEYKRFGLNANIGKHIIEEGEISI